MIEEYRTFDDKSFAELELEKIEELCLFFGMKKGASIRAFLNDQFSKLPIAS